MRSLWDDIHCSCLSSPYSLATNHAIDCVWVNSFLSLAYLLTFQASFLCSLVRDTFSIIIKVHVDLSC